MAEREKIFVAFCYAEKKWLDRVQSALASAGNIVVWDENNLRAKKNWRAELPSILQASSIAVIMVSELFLESDFIRRAKLPAMLKTAAREGLEVRWVLATHCLHEAAGFEEAEALNEIDKPLDVLSASGREAVFAEIGRKLRKLGGVAEPPPPAENSAPAPQPAKGGSSRKGEKGFPGIVATKPPPAPPLPEPDPAPTQPYVLPLGEVIEMRTQTIASLRRLARWLLRATVAIILVSLIVAIASGSSSLFLLVAGFGFFIATVVFALHRRIDYFGQRIVGIRYVRTAMDDPGLPTRQRAALMQKADAILGRV